MNKLNEFSKKWKQISSSFLHILLFQSNPFLLELSYFITLSLLGFLALKSSKPRTSSIASSSPKDIDLFVTSVSAVTVSSMTTVEMEVFSNLQLILLTILMLLGGEVFTSMLGLHFARAKLAMNKKLQSSVNTSQIESHQNTDFDRKMEGEPMEEGGIYTIKRKSMKVLAYLVSCYLLVVHALGSCLISVYLSLIPSARRLLKRKGISMRTFSIFTAVSTFANCGFVPTNENMMVFKKNSGLLLILIPQVLMGNTLYPVCLRLSICFMDKVTKRAEFRYMLENSKELGYGHLISGPRCVYLAITALGFIVVQMVVFCLVEWGSKAIFGGGMSVYEKVVGTLFQVVNSRHAGESVFDLSAFSPAVLVLYVMMMYLPPYTSYVPIDEQGDRSMSTSDRGEKYAKKQDGSWEKLVLSQLTYLSIFIIVICITERHKMKSDPLNFNVLNIVVEVISAYGNVGFSVGYSCERQIHSDDGCKDAWYGFAGRWSNEGKFVLVVVMFFGRLKKFSLRGGRAWILA